MLIVLGSFVGLLVGLTGVGGGALLTPLLIVVAGARPTLAVGTDLAFAAITKTVGAGVHLRSRTADLVLTLRWCRGSIPGALLGAHLVAGWEQADAAGADPWVTRVLGMTLLAAAVATIRRALGVGAVAPVRRVPAGLVPSAIGFGVGLLVGITSVGAGSLLMAAFALLYALPAPHAVGTDVLHGAVLAAVAAVAHGLGGRIDWGMLVSLLAGSVPGVLIGSRLCTRLPSRPLGVGIGTLLAISGVQVLRT